MWPSGFLAWDIGDCNDLEILAAKQNSEGLNAIIHAITPDLQHHVTTCNKSKDAWDILDTVFEGNAAEKEARLQNLASDWENLRMYDDETFGEFNQRLSQIVNSSYSLGRTIPEKVILCKILRSLPSRYESKKHAIEEANSLSTLSRNTLVGKLKIFDNKHAGKKGMNKHS